MFFPHMRVVAPTDFRRGVVAPTDYRRLRGLGGTTVGDGFGTVLTAPYFAWTAGRFVSEEREAIGQAVIGTYRCDDNNCPSYRDLSSVAKLGIPAVLVLGGLAGYFIRKRWWK